MALAAERCVADLKAQGAQFVICLSHSGTLEGRGEDYELARAVDGIDLIVSGHTHTTLGQPIVVNGTYIVSAGPYCRNLGSITLSWSESGGKTLEDYRLIPIDETRPEDPAIAALVEGWKEQVGETYLKGYGLTYDQVLTVSGFGLPTPRSGVQEGNSLGELVADAFLYAAKTVDQAVGLRRAVHGGGQRRNLRFSTGGGVSHWGGTAGRTGGGCLCRPHHAGGSAVLRRGAVCLQSPSDIF